MKTYSTIFLYGIIAAIAAYLALQGATWFADQFIKIKPLNPQIFWILYAILMIAVVSLFLTFLSKSIFSSTDDDTDDDI